MPFEGLSFQLCWRRWSNFGNFFWQFLLLFSENKSTPTFAFNIMVSGKKKTALEFDVLKVLIWPCCVCVWAETYYLERRKKRQKWDRHGVFSQRNRVPVALGPIRLPNLWLLTSTCIPKLQWSLVSSLAMSAWSSSPVCL